VLEGGIPGVDAATLAAAQKTLATSRRRSVRRRDQKHWACLTFGAQHDRDVNAAKNLRAEGLHMLADLSPATAEGRGSDARQTLQRRATMNRESAQRSAQAATETRQARSGAARRRIKAGL